MATKKTYGVRGLMDWNCLIHVGKAKVHIPFTGGTLSAYGVTPAEYTTDNPMVQAVIENSDYFKQGKIQIIRSSEETTETNAKESKLEKKVFANIDDARDFLAEEHSVPRSKIRSLASVIDFGKGAGFDIVIE
jgi:hypothetical protein